MEVGVLTHLLISAADQSSNASGGIPIAVLIILGVIAVIPGLWGAVVAGRTRRDAKEKDDLTQAQGTGQAGVALAQTAFKQLEAEIDSLRSERREWQLERERWSAEREAWRADRLRLLTRIEALNFQILRLRQVLVAAGVTVPDIGSALESAGIDPVTGVDPESLVAAGMDHPSVAYPVAPPDPHAAASV